MTDTLILLRSKYGASRQYAQWLHEQIPSELAEQSSFKPQNLKAYSQIVLFGGIYAGSIAGVTFLIKHRELLAGKTLAVFAVGASPASPDVLAVLQKKLNKDLPSAHLYYGRGSYDEQQMHFLDRTMCRMLRKSLVKKDPAVLQPWEQGLLESAGRGCCSWCDPEALKPLCALLERENKTAA